MTFRITFLFAVTAAIAISIVLNEVSPWFGFAGLVLLTVLAKTFLKTTVWRGVVAFSILTGLVFSVCFYVMLWLSFSDQRVATSHRYGPELSSNEVRLRDSLQQHVFPVGFIVGGALGLICLASSRIEMQMEGGQKKGTRDRFEN